MKTYFLLLGTFVLSIVMSIASAQSLEATDLNAHLRLVPGGRLWLEGDSTLHKYSARATRFDVTFDPGAKTDALATVEDLIRSGQIKTLVVSIPVRGLSSGESGLDENMHKALKAVQAPDIVFRMNSYEVPSGRTASGTVSIKLRGTLSVAGIAKDVDLELQGKPTTAGLALTGEKRLLMSEFGVEPPVLMLGMIKTADAVTVKFDFSLQLDRDAVPANLALGH